MVVKEFTLKSFPYSDAYSVKVPTVDHPCTPFNPIALRKAKIVCNFGLSECYRVMVTLPIPKMDVSINVRELSMGFSNLS